MANAQLDHHAHRPAAGKHALRLLAHDVRRPANVGSLFRLADALGVEHLHLTGASCRPPHPKLHTAARHTELHVPYDYAPDPRPVVAALKAAGYRIVCLEITSASIALDAFEVAAGERLCLVLGNESVGVSQALLDAADATVHIPMQGVNSSMNVACACAIAAWAITRRL
jgi:tRNA G18 (ribose-2'-O)-methylase SpoU